MHVLRCVTTVDQVLSSFLIIKESLINLMWVRAHKRLKVGETTNNNNNNNIQKWARAAAMLREAERGRERARAAGGREERPKKTHPCIKTRVTKSLREILLE